MIWGEIRTLRNLKRGPPLIVLSATPGCEDLEVWKYCTQGVTYRRAQYSTSTAHSICGMNSLDERFMHMAH